MNQHNLSQFLQALSAGGIRFYKRNDIPAGAAPRSEFKNLFYKSHSHPQLEMICLLRGELALNINGHWRVCPPESVQVFIPGTIHGEHYLVLEKGYRMLWATVLPATLIFHLTEYNPRTGYNTSQKRMAITPPICPQLWQTSRTPDFADDLKLRAKFQCLLMECLCCFLSDPEMNRMQPADFHEQIIEQIKYYINEYFWKDISLAKMANIAHYSPGHLNAMFRQSEKMPLHRYINEVRLQKAREFLERGEMLVKQAALATGFKDPLYFSRLFTRRFGVNPSFLATRKKKSSAESVGKSGRIHPRGTEQMSS